jgi:hypothetical protein
MFQTTPGLVPHIRKNIHLPMSFVRFTNLPVSANSAQTAKIDLSSPFLPSQTTETQLGVRTSRYIFPNNLGGKIKKKKEVKRPTDPIFFAMLPYYTFFFGLTEPGWE